MADIATFGKGEAGDPGTEQQGFRASLQGAALADLVQMECLARTEGSFRVISEGRVGYLFFQNGQFTHALLDDSIGEEAALEILEWPGGTFEPCRVAWPEKPSITRHWQSLLLSVARARDESKRRPVAAPPESPPARPTSSTKLRTLPPPKPARALPAVTTIAQAAAVTAAPALSSHPAKNSTPNAPDDSVRAFVRLDRRGKLLSARGDGDALAEVASYASRLGNLLGDALGMTGFAGLEATHRGERYVLTVDTAGNIFAFSAPLDASPTASHEPLET
jgi:hypothetical protein